MKWYDMDAPKMKRNNVNLLFGRMKEEMRNEGFLFMRTYITSESHFQIQKSRHKKHT